jgi:hypothetical protein
MAATIESIKPAMGKAADAITIVGTGFTDAPSMSTVWVRAHGDTAWTKVDAARVAFVSATALTLTLNATEFDSGGMWDIGVADNADTEPDDYLLSALYFYSAGTFDPDAVIKGAPIGVYVAGEFMGHSHGGATIPHEITTSEVEVDQSLLPIRVMKAGEKFSIKVPLAEVTLEHIKAVWGVSAQIQDLGGGRRRLTFGGDQTITEVAVLLVVPAGSGKEFAALFYRCSVTGGGDLIWSRDEQVDLPLEVTVLADTSRAVGDQVGCIEEYTPA